jgi:hypothetical protein
VSSNLALLRSSLGQGGQVDNVQVEHVIVNVQSQRIDAGSQLGLHLHAGNKGGRLVVGPGPQGSPYVPNGYQNRSNNQSVDP